MSTRFYINWPLQPGPVTLQGPEAHHLASVCRLRPGDAVCLFNGDGREYPARIVAIQRRAVALEIEGSAAPERELPFELEVAAPLPKGDRAQFLIEKLTELGATSFVPLNCDRSVMQPRDAKLEKLQRYVIEASKQCGRNKLMQIMPAAIWREYSRPRQAKETRWLAQPYQGASGPCATPVMKPIRVAVGPEGGFSDEEIAIGRDRGWELIDLGPRILRVETAALVMASKAIAMP